jgi:glucokinase
VIVGVDIGGTKIAVAGFVEVYGGLEMVTEPRTAPTPASAGGGEIVRVVRELINDLDAAANLEAVGVGTAGVVDADGFITSATDALSGWAGFALRRTLSDAVGVRTTVVNDVHAAALAEAEIGAGVDADSMLMVAVGTGIGGAIVSSDGLRRGATGTAGSLGHVEVAADGALGARRCPCGGGNRHVEAIASGPAMEQTYFDRTGARATLPEIDALARRGDPIAADLIAEGGRMLGHALASANALLDVDVIVIGGGVAEIGERYLAAVDEGYRTAVMPALRRTQLVGADLRANATLTGAAISAWREARQ